MSDRSIPPLARIDETYIWPQLRAMFGKPPNGPTLTVLEDDHHPDA